MSYGTPPAGSAICRDQRAKNVRFINNLLVRTSGSHFNGIEGNGWIWGKNVLYGGPTGLPDGHAGIITGTNPNMSDTEADGPKRPTSGVNDQGSSDWGTFPAVTLDMDGQTRIPPPDIGADETVGGGITNYPLSGSNVGPSWFTRRTMNGPISSSPHYVVQAENFTASLDPNGDGDKWIAVTDAAAGGGKYIKAPAGSIPDVRSMPHDAIVEYDFVFHDAGTYYLYIRARGVDGGSDSIFTPTAFNADPSIVKRTTSNNQWDWVAGGVFTISAEQRNIPLTLKIGKREMDANIDCLVFTTSSSVPSPAVARL